MTVPQPAKVQVITVGKVGPTGAGVTTHEDQSATIMHVRQVTSATRPSSPIEGQIIYETDTNKYTVWDGSAWIQWDLSDANRAHGARVTASAVKSLPDGVDTVVDFNTERYDTDTFHDTVFNNSRLTIPSGLGGLYLIEAVAGFASNATGRRIARIKKGGVTVSQITIPAVGSSTATQVLISHKDSAAAAEYFELWMEQDSGGAINTLSGTVNMWFAITRIGKI